MKNKIVLLLVLLPVFMFGESTALFATVKNVAKDDRLNVRAEANHKSTKVGELPPSYYVGVEKCKKIKSSTWCKVYPLVQQWSEKFAENSTGWVNAHYLNFHDRGYVTIEGEKNNCYYAIACKNDLCNIVKDMQYDHEKDKMPKMQTKWIKRSRLKGESAFGAASSDMEGYCTNGNRIEDNLKKNAVSVHEKS